ncbi:MAG: hypothetical protein IKO62_00750 [Bacteroidales bacterium]|nr:hypothetical protein [Bacteroidales bacterium]
MKKENVKEKTQVYNVVILDKSGSMGSIKSAAVEGFNETLVGIKKAQDKFAETQQHYLSLVAFCGCEMKVLYDKVPVSEAQLLDMNEYQPCCSTPLFDAMGFTLTDIRKHVKDLKDAMVVVTIITDGMENASKEYSVSAVKSLVDELRHEGWTFTYMGANQDAVEVAVTLSIRNARNFDYSSKGAKMAMAKDSSTRMNLYQRIHKFRTENMDADAMLSTEERNDLYASMANEAFDEEENN